MAKTVDTKRATAGQPADLPDHGPGLDEEPGSGAVDDQRARARQQLISWLGTGIVAAILVVAILIFFSNRRGSDSVPGGPGDPATVVGGQAQISEIGQDGRSLGDAEAPVVVIEYGDYQCPHCTRFHRESMERLMSGYIRPGLIRFEFHEYPVLSQRSDGSFDTDGESWRAAEASLCANDQGQYWPYHDALYANSIGISQGSFTPDRLVEIARQVPALDIAGFQSCIVGRTQTSAVQELASEAMASGIDSTPTFVINGERIEGADWTAISEAIDDKLAETSPG